MKPFTRSMQLIALALASAAGMQAAGAAHAQAQPARVAAPICPIFASCFFVTNANDAGPGSLRQAMLDANAATGRRIIKFNVDFTPVVIQPIAALPMLLGDTTIDCFSQPGAEAATETSPPNVEVVINGLFSAGFWGLNLGVGRNVVQGCAINDFSPGSGIVINSDDNVVRGCMLGVDRDATFARPNAQAGVNINIGRNNLIGGPGIDDRNVISGNGAEGVLVFGSDNEVYGNAIGTSFDGSTVLGNGGPGVSLFGEGNNEIGGVGEGEGNIIAGNAGDGIAVHDGTDNTFAHNAIYDNGELGIDLADDGVTRNDGLLDLDAGPNALQNFPRLLSVTLDPASEFDGRYKAEVSWLLRSTASTKYRVEFYASAACDASGNGEAERFLGSRAIDTDAAGLAENVWELPGRVAPGEEITALATELVDVGNSHQAAVTSELSMCLPTSL